MKKQISLLLSVTIILTGLLGLNLFASAAWSVTPETPELVDGYYEISSPAHFMWLASNPYAQCRLINDIQIGEKGNPFTTPFKFAGTLIGYDKSTAAEAKKTITAYITASGQHTGLFSTAEASKKIIIKNIVLRGEISLTSGSFYAGGFYGQISNITWGSSIEKCDNYAKVTSVYQRTGGIVGDHSLASSGDLKLNGCRNFGTISTTGYYGGGIVGASKAEITTCANMGAVSADYYGAGIAGWYLGNSFNQNYNQGEIKANVYAAGIIGNADNSALIITNCYNTGAVTSPSTAASASLAAGIAGYATNNTKIEYCYNVGIITGNSSSSSIFGNNKTGFAFTASYSYYLADGRAQKAGTTSFNSTDSITLTGWNFSDAVWEVATEGYLYPRLKNNSHYVVLGSIFNPYLITDQESFEAIKDNPGAYYRLENDITLIDYTPFIFKGTLFAKTPKTIRVSISANESDDIGLFSSVIENTAINKITVSGTVIGKDNVGGLIGRVASGATVTLTDCTVKAESETEKVSGATYVGGLIGFIDPNVTSVSVTDCVNNLPVTATMNSVGGLLGRFHGAATKITVNGFKNYGNIEGPQIAGGIAGVLSGSVSKSINSGDISSQGRIGGLIGWMTGGSISTSYNAGSIKTENAPAGGLVGLSQYANISVANSYNAGNVFAVGADAIAGAVIGEVNSGSLTATNFYNVGYIYGLKANDFYGKGSFTANNSYYLFNGDDEIAETKNLEQMKEAAGSLGSSFTKSLNDYPFPQINGNSKETGLVLYQVLVIQPENGNIYPEGSFYYSNKDTLPIKSTPNDGYFIKEILINGVPYPIDASPKITGNTEIGATVLERPAVDVETIISETANLDITVKAPEFEDGDSIQTQNGLMTLGKSTTYVVAMTAINDYYGWTVKDYGINLTGKNYSGAGFIKDNKYGVMFYGYKIEQGGAVNCKPYVTYINEKTKEELTVFGQEKTI